MDLKMRWGVGGGREQVVLGKLNVHVEKRETKFGKNRSVSCTKLALC